MANPSRTWHKQPLPYFLALGALIFALDSVLSQDDNVIVVSQAVRSEVALKTELELGRTPQPEEVQAALEQWRETEALYREGLKLGLLDNDEVVRAHIANKLRYVASQRVVVSEPSETTLRAYLRAHEERFRQPTAFDLEHVFVARHAPGLKGDAANPRVRAEQLLKQLRQGADWKTLGDHFPRGPQFSNRSRQDLERALKLDLSSAFDSPRTDVWTMVEGKRGFHLLRITRISGGVDFDRLKETLRLAVQADEKERAAQRFVDEVQGRYEFEVEP